MALLRVRSNLRNVRQTPRGRSGSARALRRSRRPHPLPCGESDGRVQISCHQEPLSTAGDRRGPCEGTVASANRRSGPTMANCAHPKCPFDAHPPCVGVCRRTPLIKLTSRLLLRNRARGPPLQRSRAELRCHATESGGRRRPAMSQNATLVGGAPIRVMYPARNTPIGAPGSDRGSQNMFDADLAQAPGPVAELPMYLRCAADLNTPHTQLVDPFALTSCAAAIEWDRSFSFPKLRESERSICVQEFRSERSCRRPMCLQRESRFCGDPICS